MKLLCAIVLAAAMNGLWPGQHTQWPKYWPSIDRYVTNYTPYELDFRIDDLTPDDDAGLWFSVGHSIEHIDRAGRMESFSMPSDYWLVSSVVIHNNKVFFSAGQSGKIGIIDRDNQLNFIQVVPSRYFPSLRDLVLNRAGEMWFLDVGRKSIGYRSANGRVVENPVPGGAYPIKMQHCMGRLWVSASTDSYGHGGFGVVDSSFHLQWRRLDPTSPTNLFVSDMTCDAKNRLWLTISSGRTSYVARLDRKYTPFWGAAAATRIYPARDGGVWITSWFTPRGRASLIHIDANDRLTTLELPTQNVSSLADSAENIWLATNAGGSPISVTRLSLRRQPGY